MFKFLCSNAFLKAPVQENTKLIKNCHIWCWSIILNSENPASKVLSRLSFGKWGVLLQIITFLHHTNAVFLPFKCKFQPVLKWFGNFGGFWEPRTELQPEPENRNWTSLVQSVPVLCISSELNFGNTKNDWRSNQQTRQGNKNNQNL